MKGHQDVMVFVAFSGAGAWRPSQNALCMRWLCADISCTSHNTLGFTVLSVQEEAAALELQACLLISAGQCLGGGLLVAAWQGWGPVLWAITSLC